jgi:ribosomal protein S18 acetylase RimI-like enzyme
MIAYRDADPQDAEQLVNVFHRGFCDTFAHLYDPRDLAAFLAEHTPDHWREQLEDPRFAIRIAQSDDEICGFIKLGPLKLPVADADGPIELRQLYVLKAWHGSGIAAELMDWSIAEARRRGARQMFLSVYTNNPRARRFYERAGFEGVGHYHFMVGNHADEDVIMRKLL